MRTRRRSSSHRGLVVVLSIFCLILIGFGVWLFLQSRSNTSVLAPTFSMKLDAIDPGVVAGPPDGVSKKERAPGDGLFGYRINLAPTFSAESKRGDLEVHNPAFNSYILVVELCLADSEQVIYRSQYIPPDHNLPAVWLNDPLEIGSYSAVAYLNLIDPKTMQLADILEQPLTLQVT